jgi:esterase/lipase
MPIASSLFNSLRHAFTRDTAKVAETAPVQEVEQKLAVPIAKVATTPVRAVDATSYKQAVDRLQKRMESERAQELPSAEAKFRLQAHDESIFKAQPYGKAKGTVVMFHGYTAGPWQYQELSDKLYKEGYNVWAPLLPGHGVYKAGGAITNEKFIHAADRQRYDVYVDARYREAAALGAPVYTLGLSGGSNVALRTAERHPEVKGVFAMAPFLGPNHPGSYLFSTLAFLDKITFGLFGRFMDLIPEARNGMADMNSVTPHNETTFGEALAIEQLGANIKDIKAPVQFITTANDGCSGTEKVGPLFERIGGASKNGWFHFSADRGVPHPMVSRLQDKAPGAVDQIDQMVLDFVAGQRTMRRPAGTPL